MYSVSEQVESKKEDVGGAEEKVGEADHEAGDDEEASDSDTDDLAKLVETLQSVADSGSEQEAPSYNTQYTYHTLLVSCTQHTTSLAGLDFYPGLTVRLSPSPLAR